MQAVAPPLQLLVLVAPPHELELLKLPEHPPHLQDAVACAEYLLRGRGLLLRVWQPVGPNDAPRPGDVDHLARGRPLATQVVDGGGGEAHCPEVLRPPPPHLQGLHVASQHRHLDLGQPVVEDGATPSNPEAARDDGEGEGLMPRLVLEQHVGAKCAHLDHLLQGQLPLQCLECLQEAWSLNGLQLGVEDSEVDAPLLHGS
uniref:Uncharacterized protein n=1 Tax=Strombidium rassoulzadegani TaxID=1082188 RepID=A0A7S3FRM8_9SPIT|mmetsp:Transcript_11365/g.19156  ORF Transcript_11365/g.19156 Transcript_11365/m.19156 type:complete len:201 (+) Transcript_11365:387-989(+)